MKRNIYSVGQVNAYIKNMFAQDFLMSRIYVRGEVSNCKYHSSGHIYFTLKDKTGILQAVMFSGSRRNGLKFRMKEGDNVIVLGSVRVYERDGKYQMYAEEILLEGAGLLYQQFEALKRELEEMGMFDPIYKKPVPRYAAAVGVVTAITGAAIRDIQNIASRRNPYVQLILYPAQVQGEGAAQSVVNGIRALEQRGVDVIIVGRGGGSIEDLWAFNEEIVARAIFECEVPVISAVGHETDTTIADYVADLRAPTPSAAAELAVFDIRQVFEHMEEKRLSFYRALSGQVEKKKNILRQYQLKLRIADPRSRLLENRQIALDHEERLQRRMEQILKDRRHRLQLLASALEGQSPLKKLSGGYAFVTDQDGRRVTRAAELSPQDRITAYLTDGSITARVETVNLKVTGNAEQREGKGRADGR